MQKLVCFCFTDENSGGSEEGRVLPKSHSKREADLEQGPGLLLQVGGLQSLTGSRAREDAPGRGACCETQAGETEVRFSFETSQERCSELFVIE